VKARLPAKELRYSMHRSTLENDLDSCQDHSYGPSIHRALRRNRQKQSIVSLVPKRLYVIGLAKELYDARIVSLPN
jgi:hypothetical protein